MDSRNAAEYGGESKWRAWAGGVSKQNKKKYSMPRVYLLPLFSPSFFLLYLSYCGEYLSVFYLKVNATYGRKAPSLFLVNTEKFHLSPDTFPST